MRIRLLAFLAFAFCVSSAQAAVTVEKTETTASLKNGSIQVDIDLSTSSYSVKNIVTSKTAISNAGLVIGFDKLGRDNYKKHQPLKAEAKAEDIKGLLGKGKKITLSAKDDASGCTKIYIFEVYENSPFVIIGFGIENKSDKPVRVYYASAVASGELFSGAKIENPMMLNGGAGDRKTIVRKGSRHRDQNSLMLTGKVDGKRQTIVAGGLTHYDYIKEVEYGQSDEKSTVTAFSWDPFGRMVEAGGKYMSKDKIYIDCITANPFEALEDYGLRVKAANNINLNYFNFPTFCGWAMSMKHMGFGGNYNNSAALVKIANDVKNDGFTRFAPVALRLEPDTYLDQSATCSQGWYDDEHFRKFKKLVPPHNTFKEFTDDMKKAGAIPFSYVQVNMPDPEWAKAHPDWLLAGHEKYLANKPGKYPPYRWDTTDKEFGKYMVGLWKRWGGDGLVGIKHDYPQTGWFINGGFDDPHATCTSAYKKWFELCREGLGPKGIIHERNLSRNKGVLNRAMFPSLDTCIGVNDLQRVSKDNSHIEPEFLTKIALRWYKNRVVMSYYPDCKAMTQNRTDDIDADKRQTILTMISLISGRLEISTPYDHWTPAVKHDMSRVFPVLTTPKSPRPVDMLTGKKDVPEVYVYDVNPSWVHAIFFNAENQKRGQPATVRKISAPLSGDQADTGSLGLKADKEYYVYDFWGNKLVGKFKGTDTISAELTPCRSTIYSVREVEENPQVVSCSRHILQGMLELSDVKWKKKTLKGKAQIIKNDPMIITIACNGEKPESVKVNKGSAKILPLKVDRVVPNTASLCRIELTHDKSEEVEWEVAF